MSARSKVFFIIDGNYFFFRTLFVMGEKVKGEDGQWLLINNEKTYSDFIKKLCLDFCAQYRNFRDIATEVVFVSDSKSWRKKYYPEYKANRLESEPQWNSKNLERAQKEFPQILAKAGVILHKTDGAEGDDLITAWSNYANSKKYDAIVFTGDKDMLQIVRTHPNGRRVIVYDPSRSRIFIDQNFKKWHQSESSIEESIFNIGTNTEEILKESYTGLIRNLNSKRFEFIDINSYNFLMRKVLIGDGGDNVPSVYSYQKNGKTYKISEKKADAILEDANIPVDDLNRDIMLSNDEALRKIVNSIIKIMKITTSDYNSILENLKRNITLMTLSETFIDAEVYENMMQDILSITSEPRNIDIEKLSSSDKLLADTAYIKQKTSFIKDDVIQDFSFIKG